MKRIIATFTLAITLSAILTACAKTGTVSAATNDEALPKARTASPISEPAGSKSVSDTKGGSASDTAGGESILSTENTGIVSSGDDIDTENLFTQRDMEHSPDLGDAEILNVTDQHNITIDTAGIYVLSGQAKEVSVLIDASDEDKVQLVLDNLTLTNKNTPCIYVRNADKVFITLRGDANSLSVTGDFSSDGDTNTDAVIFSKEDLTINGTGAITITSSDNGISGKDTLKVTGGCLNISCTGSALESKDEILISGGAINTTTSNDGLHAEDNDDDTKGYIYISGGSICITAEDDAIHATTVVRIDDGEFDLNSSEGIEGTVLQINGGNIRIEASDDGINAAHKSDSLSPVFEMNGGNVTIKMGEGDTDGIDSNGDIIINGGIIDITGKSAFDYDGSATVNGGTIIENGVETNTVTNQMMGAPDGMGGRGGMAPDGMGGRGGMAPDGMGERGGMAP